MYRFRTSENLLGKYKELENQEIYFASPEELNDPMEGYRDLFWIGDSIVWENFIINYTKSLEHLFNLISVINNDKAISDNDILVSRELFRDIPPYRIKILSQIIKKVNEFPLIKKLPSSLSKRKSPIRRSELLSYIQTIHPFIINVISNIYHENGLISKQLFYRDLNEYENVINKTGDISELFNKIEDENGHKPLEEFFTIIRLYSQSNLLQAKYNYQHIEQNSNNTFLISEFPNKYISKLELEIYPPWYSASFLSDCTNSAIWGHYGNNHKGICLKFKTTQKDKQVILNLETEYGYSSGPIIGMQPHVFRKVIYQNKHTEIDFFRTLGRMNKMQLEYLWYKDTLGNYSICGDHLKEKEEEKEWRDNYWKNFYESISIKLKEWEYENEYRLIVHGDFIDYSDKAKRKLKYNFNDLDGIIFGIKTDILDKLKIMKIIENKCKQNNRKQFDFLQAYYSRENGKIETYKLDLLKQ